MWYQKKKQSNLGWYFIGLVSVVLFVSTVYAQSLPHPNDDLGGFVNFLINAFKVGDWFFVGGAIVMLSVWIAGRTVTNTKVIPWLNISIGILYSMLAHSLNDEVSWSQAINHGVLASGEAALMWGMLGQLVLPKKKKETSKIVNAVNVALKDKLKSKD